MSTPFKNPKMVKYFKKQQRPKRLYHYIRRHPGGLPVNQTFIMVEYRGWHYLCAEVMNNNAKRETLKRMRNRFRNARTYSVNIADDRIVHGCLNRLAQRYKIHESKSRLQKILEKY